MQYIRATSCWDFYKKSLFDSLMWIYGYKCQIDSGSSLLFFFQLGRYDLDEMVKVGDFNCKQNKDTLAFSLCFKLRKANSFESANFFFFSCVLFTRVWNKKLSFINLFEFTWNTQNSHYAKKKSFLAAKKINQEKAKVNVKYWLLFALRYS